jgi:phage tail-like protein
MARSTPVDPYKNFLFQVRFAGSTQAILGVHKMTGFKRTTEVIEHRSGGDPTTSYKLPGRTKYDPIVLERGVTLNAHEFEAWANKVWSYRNAAGGVQSSLADFRRDLVVDMFDESGQKVLSYQVFSCWVSDYQPVGDFDANANAVSIEHIRVENEGWVRDLGVPAPVPVSFSDPAS